MREHQELVFISQNGMVQRIGVRGINRYGRASQGVRVMNVRDDDVVSRGRARRRVRAAEPRRRDRREGQPVSLDATGTADETGARAATVVLAGDADEDGLLDVPEVESDEMPDSDVEE